jgi:Protein of unknown function (DUF3618)
MTDAESVKAEIVATRAELAETADALAAKLDVKAQASHKLHETGDRMGAKYEQAKSSAPPQVQKAIAKVEQAAQPVLTKAGEDKKRTAMIVAGGLVGLLVLRRLTK